MNRAREEQRPGVRGLGVVFCPDLLKLVQVVWTEEGPVPRQVVKVVHDHSDEQVQDLDRGSERTSAHVCSAGWLGNCDAVAHQEGTQTIEAQEVDDGKVGPAGVFLSRQEVRLRVTLLSIHGSHHDLLPVLSSGTSGHDSTEVSSVSLPMTSELTFLAHRNNMRTA